MSFLVTGGDTGTVFPVAGRWGSAYTDQLVKLSLTAEQIAAARRFVASVPASYRRRGQEYFKDGTVTSIAVETPGQLYHVQVQGQRLYEVTLDYADGWEATCSCPMLLDCKHTVAALLALLDQAGLALLPEGTPLPVPLDRALREKLGRALTIPEAALVKQVRALHQRYAGYGGPYLSELQRLFRHVSGSSWEQIRPLPNAQRDEVAWWNHLAVVLRDRGGTVPEFLLSVVDEAAVRAQIATAERERQIANWRQHLARIADEPVPVTALARTIAVRLKLADADLELETRAAEATEFRKLKVTAFRALAEEFEAGRVTVTAETLPVWLPLFQRWQATGIHRLDAKDEAVARILGLLLRQPATRALVVNARGEPFTFAAAPLRWEVAGDANPQGDYALRLVRPDGAPAPAADWTIAGEPTLYVIGPAIFPGPPPLNAPLYDPWGRPLPVQETFVIPAPALETQDGFNLLHRLGAPLPAQWRDRVEHVALGVRLIAKLTRDYGATEWVGVRFEATGGGRTEEYLDAGWAVKKAGPVDGKEFRLFDRASLAAVPAVLAASDLKWDAFSRQWRWRVTKHFPGKFAEWLALLPPHIELKLDATLASLRDAPLRGKVRLDCEPAGVDWFDLKIVLDVADTKLAPAELKALLDARGGFVRIEGGGWRRLQFDLDAEDDTRLAQLGLSPRDFSSEPQRLHALQLADTAAARFLPAAQVADIRRRAGEIKTRVNPPVPAAVRAEMRPYQIEGFHFLAYLGTNSFGGVLADDMGLGKTLQTLAWLAWLRDEQAAAKPVLVVCPKSVKDNWHTEAERFVPGLRVTLWHGTEAGQLSTAAAATDLLVINYTQLRSLAEELAGVRWRAVILDEGQYIKNPESQTAKAARALVADHRLILTGTPIENRLLDLWSLMSFAMPGVLGPRTRFAKHFDQAGDPLARQRLAARVRPFLLRRTKAQVAPELPDRMEEDLLCEMEPAQATLYRAELKHAQQQLLKIKTAKDFDRERFNFLTSLLRLRQICCHPALVQADPSAGSAKVEALLDLVEPLMEEGHKVLVFSQFVTMIDLLQPQLVERGWKHFVLTGATENRGPLVAEFQKTPGAAVFLISLKAGGFGLNLTAASYVVLFDPWWNPAVENQAIDRTHRIGQTRPVNAYRLLIKDSIEEKIRKLQKTKSALAADVLGEERFAQSLTLDDLKFLLAESPVL